MGLRAMAAALAFAVATLAGGSATAQDNTRLALARDIMGLMQVEPLLTDFFSQMSPMLGAGLARDLGLTPTEEARMVELVVEEFRAATPGLVEEMAGVYAQNMSEQELRETVTFLRTPSGAAFLRTQFAAESELERIGHEGGTRVGMRALERFEAERRGGASPSGNKT